MDFCCRAIPERSKFAAVARRQCHLPAGHEGRCQEFPQLAHLKVVAPRVASKIVRDSVMTTGASWKSEDAGPNRILRWVMRLDDEALSTFGINMAKLKPQVVAKLREKAAEYEACIAVSQRLASMVYAMPNGPEPPQEIVELLAAMGHPIPRTPTKCLVCWEPLDFRLFAAARRGKAEVETSHSNPRLHTPENVGFAHRSCNIAQGNKTLDEFHDWIARILQNRKRSSD